jgi:short-subunit dehydrogenase
MFENKKIWIIGASTGIGAQLAKALAKEGARIALSARDNEKLLEVKASLEGLDHGVYSLDVVDADKVRLTAERIAKDFGRIDSVIFMAAAYKPHDGKEPDLAIVKQIIDVNLTGAFNLVYSALPILKSQGGGQIVLCASVAGFRGLPNGQPYCATKAALINFAESLYIENKDNNIDVRVINPGFVKTRLTDKNDFKMPFIISAEKAAQYIVKGLKKNKFEIHFPKRFTYFMKLLRILPNSIYFMLAKGIK